MRTAYSNALSYALSASLLNLNMPTNPLDNLSSLFVCVAVAWMDLDARPLLALLVSDLPTVGVELVDRQAGRASKFRLF